MHRKCGRVTYQSLCWEGPAHAKVEESSREGIVGEINMMTKPHGGIVSEIDEIERYYGEYETNNLGKKWHQKLIRYCLNVL